jgi:LacI family transcriptional regulator
MIKRTTIKDIAKAAGVNISTVSRALKDHPDIGKELTNKIKKIAQALHYHPNMTAVQLRKQKSNLIGLIIPEAYMFFFPSVIKGISDVVQSFGYKLMVLMSNENLQQEIENVKICYEAGIDGLLMTLSKQTKELSHLNELKEDKIPVVLLDKVLENSGFDEVLIDDENATLNCTDYLIKNGCKNILGIFGNENLAITQKRLSGFLSTIENNRKIGVKSDRYFVESTFEAWQFIENNYPQKRWDGIFAMSDEVIAGIIPALNKLNIKIPENCAIIGFSDGFLPRILTPQVTYLHHDGLALGKLAASHLIQKINKKNGLQSSPERMYLPTQLVIQASTR